MICAGKMSNLRQNSPFGSTLPGIHIPHESSLPPGISTRLAMEMAYHFPEMEVCCESGQVSEGLVKLVEKIDAAPLDCCKGRHTQGGEKTKTDEIKMSPSTKNASIKPVAGIGTSIWPVSRGFEPDFIVNSA